MKRLFRLFAMLCALALVAVACGDDDGDTADSTTTTQATTSTTAADEADDEADEELEETGKLVVYTSGPAGLKAALTEDFTSRTGIEVEMFQGTTGEILGRLEAEASNPVADIVILASWVPAVQFMNDGMTQPYESEHVSALRDGWYEPDFHFYGFSGSALVLSLNTGEAPSVPTDWEDLADPAWRDLVIMPDPRESGTAADLVAALVMHYGDEAWELFDALDANGLAVQGPNRPALDSVVTGVHGAVVGGVDYMAWGDIAKGEQLDVVFPASGTTVTPRPVLILDSAVNVRSAQMFIDYILSPEAQQIVADAHLIPSRTDMEPVSGPAYEEITLLDFDWDELAEASGAILEEFASRYLS